MSNTLLSHAATDTVGKLVEAESAYYAMRDELRDARSQLTDPMGLVLSCIRALHPDQRADAVGVARYRLDALAREFGIVENEEEETA